MKSLDIATRVAWSFLGRPYVWAGDNPNVGFDCSGFMVEILKSAGKLSSTGDWSAQSLFDRFRAIQGTIFVKGAEGMLVCYGGNWKSITHIEYCLDATFAIGASGGGSKTLTMADAISQDAYIKVRPILKRPDIVGFVDPFANERS